MQKAVRQSKIVSLSRAITLALLVLVSVVQAEAKDSAPLSAVPEWRFDPIPPGGDCSRIGWTYDGTPFSGWPMEQHVCEIVVILREYCDERWPFPYPHWGTDIRFPGIEGANVLSTTDYAIVGRAHDEGDWNGGMGNYVELRALDCWKERQHLRCLNEECESILEPFPELDVPQNIWQMVHTEICFDTGWFATYMHLQAVTVEVGQRVDRGEVIGRVGDTGFATGFHLHYEITSPFNGPGGAVDAMPTMCDEWIEPW